MHASCVLAPEYGRPTGLIVCVNFARVVGVQNVYDVILDTNGVPILPELPAELYMVSAAQVRRQTLLSIEQRLNT